MRGLIERNLSYHIAIILCLAAFSGFGQNYSVSSPDGINKIEIKVGEQITYSVRHKEGLILDNSPISMIINGKDIGRNPAVRKTSKRAVNEVINPVVRVKRGEIQDNYNELTLHFKGGFGLIFRSYDDGVAYRFFTRYKKDIMVNDELVSYQFTSDYEMELPLEESMYSHFEREYVPITIRDFHEDSLSSLPAMVKLNNNVKVIITETDLFDYPGMFLHGSGEKGLVETHFANYPKKIEKTSDRDVMVLEREKFLAKTAGERSFPWRMLVITDEDKALLENELVFKLSAPNSLSETDWIKPGKVAWDWYNANNIFGVDFESGINTATYKYYIDFASKYGLEYIVLDEGWYDITVNNLLKPIPEIDMTELIAYGKQKNVDLILWVTWKALDDQLVEALQAFKVWGIKGIKVDFMQRDDQWMVNYYEKVAKEAAKHQLLVDFHGSYKPAGLQRKYPHVLTREGVRGLEWSKWSSDTNPVNSLKIPFIRMVAGAMDFTPGAMRNAQKANHKDFFTRPISLGTRCHQLAMYVIFESPLQMLADTPSSYYKEEECMEFLAPVPSVWDDTKVLDASYGNYIITSRRSKGNYYVGAMTNWDDRDLEVDFSFLPDGDYEAVIFQDGVNADKMAEDYRKTTQVVNNKKKLTVHLAPGGGWVAMVSKKK